MQRRMEMKLGELNQRLHRRRWLRNIHALDLGRRPDAQSAALAPDAPLSLKGIAKREMEAVELDAGMEAIRKRRYQLLPDEWLGTMRNDIYGNGHNRQKAKNASPHPPWPAGSAPRRDPGRRKLHLSSWMPFSHEGEVIFFLDVR